MRVSEFLPHLTIERPVRHGALTMVPLSADRWLQLEPLCLDEALDRGAVRLAEGTQAEVNRIQAVHQGRRPVLLLAGEEVVGARQNRILDTSAWLSDGRQVDLPVSCVEQGRWGGGSEFRSGRTVYLPRSRSAHTREVTRSYQHAGRAAADQSRVWADVAQRLQDQGIRSDTTRMHDLYRPGSADLHATLRPTRTQCGFAFLSGDRFLGLELFPTGGFCRRVYDKYLDSYALESQTLAPRPLPDPDRVARFLHRVVRELARSESQSFQAPGGARDLRFRSPRLHGSGLVVEPLGLAHLSAFPA